ncbi:fimbrial protein [Budviciaceae bacterium CWB-B4]|uniref:Fimbrial protein n=1 Tax=Limnobaculum xujianqingii TaxID=2738837 RepID=A0A9D7AFD2_9GAMM|nr:fimbrial protein [Limnobaculum xujianqingii]MBK5071718.1 fimbrial protein [Limnobaculum xujianqingii]MBK5175027.1 fimbrial protein [Limnobaculum xujianqingii]
MKKFFNVMLLLVGCFFYANNSYSYCTPYSIRTNTFNFGVITVQRDTPVGTVLKTVATSIDNQTFDSCTGNSYDRFVLTYPGAASTSLSNVFSTNIPGIGIRVYMPDGAVWYYTPSGSIRYFSGNTNGINYAPTYIDVVKIGPASSGTFTSGTIARQIDDSGAGGINIVLTGGSVVAVACSITTPNVNVPLDPVLASSFTGVNSTKGDKPFTIGLNCDAGARINASLSFDQNTDTSNTSVIKLTGAGSAGVATGVGIQLLYGSTPLQRNTNIVLKTSTGGQEFPAGSFTARYFQTRSTVTTGDANATATLNLTYQ